ncbi:MAG: PorV/PorQ family protein [candidate division Zixibacteria bacterium]|nr:PorV/PorQ family protein [candidate division Zixibacteria bacterium]
MINRIAHSLIFCLLLALLGSAVFAADAGRESPFSLGAGVRALGMGGGFVGLADDATAVYWNQAALPWLNEQEVEGMHVTLFEGTIYDVVSLVYPHASWGGFGVSYMHLGTGDIPIMNEGFEVGKMSYSTGQMILAYGRRLQGGYSFGTALKLVNQSLGDNSTYGVGMDLSFMARVTPHVSAGVLFQDIIAPRLRLSGNLEITPMSVQMGVGFSDIKIGSDFNNNAVIALEKPEYRATKLHLGVESIYRDLLAFRTGFDRENVTFGLGVYYNRLRFDYAYRIINDITDSHRIGLSIKFGTPVSERLRLDAELENARGSYLILDDRQRQFDLYKNIADDFYASQQMDSAYAYYQRALAYKEDDQETKNRIDELAQRMETEKDQVREELNRAEQDRSLADSYYRQAESMSEQGSLDAALRIAEQGRIDFPDDQRFNDLKSRITQKRAERIEQLTADGKTAEKERRFTDALMFYNQVLTLAPGNVAVKQSVENVKKEITIAGLIFEGTELYTTKNLSESKRRFEQVVELDPGNRVANEYLSRISAVMKEVTDLEDLQKDEQVWQIYLNALEHFRDGEYQQAIELWQQVLQYYPGNVNTINNIEQAKLRLNPEE